MTTSLTFRVRPRDGDPTAAVEVTPVVGDIPLTDRIRAFESAHGWPIRADAYGGVIPAHYRFGPAEAHYSGLSADADGLVPLLGCSCGEWGRWPLLARVVVEDRAVTWRDFCQPHSPERDYSAFGPFEFTRSSYERALVALSAVWDPTQGIRDER